MVGQGSLADEVFSLIITILVIVLLIIITISVIILLLVIITILIIVLLIIITILIMIIVMIRSGCRTCRSTRPWRSGIRNTSTTPPRSGSPLNC